MAFRFRNFKPFIFLPSPVEVEKQVSNFDEHGIEHVSYTSVSAQSVIDSLPRPSEVTIMSQMQSGILKPVSLDDFEVSDLDSNVASNIINSLNIHENENS